MNKLIIIIVTLIIPLTVFSQAWKTYPYSPTGSLISFPADEGRHSDEPVEWWYTVGHLTGNTTGKHYSYMLSYFYYPASIFDGFRILNISDDDEGLFFAETKPLNYTTLATDRLNIEAAVFTGVPETWKNKTDAGGNPLPFEYEISATAANGTLNLEYDALKPPLILADSGFLYQGASEYTYYYSLTKNAVSGSITFNGITENVNGTSWIDRQYGTFNPSDGHDYEWFSLQLNNGMDINIFNVFTDNNEIPKTLAYRFISAYVNETTQYTSVEIDVERLEYVYTSDNKMCYSQKWRITSAINNVDLIVSTLHSDNEVILPFRFYEGPTNVTGTVNGNNVTGVGFAELVHSYEKPIIQISKYANLADASTQLLWLLDNPDDGNPLKYDLEYSIDNQQTFIPIAQGVVGTSYYWNTLALSGEDDIWLKVTGYSIDNTLSNSSIEKLIQGTPSLNNTENKNPINIYPNPSTGQFTIEGINIRNIEICDLKGRIIYESPADQTPLHINLDTQQKGNYLIKLTTDSGTITETLIIE